MDTLPPDWYKEEDIPSGIDPPSARLKAMLKKIAREFREGMSDTRDMKKLHDDIAYERSLWSEEQIDAHAFVVAMLELLNAQGVPLTRSIMNQYGISDFVLSPEDFDRVCLDFVHAKHNERMIVDRDSIPEDYESLPMSPDEIGGELKGTLMERDDVFYLEGYKDEFVYAFTTNEALRARAKENVGQNIKALIVDSQVQDFTIIVST